MPSAERTAFEPMGPMRRAGEDPKAGLAREEMHREANPTCSDGIARRQSWYSAVLRTPKLRGSRQARACRPAAANRNRQLGSAHGGRSLRLTRQDAGIQVEFMPASGINVALLFFRATDQPLCRSIHIDQSLSD